MPTLNVAAFISLFLQTDEPEVLDMTEHVTSSSTNVVRYLAFSHHRACEAAVIQTVPTLQVPKRHSFLLGSGSRCRWRERSNRYCWKGFGTKVDTSFYGVELGVQTLRLVLTRKRDWKPKGNCWLCVETWLTTINKFPGKILIKLPDVVFFKVVI